MSEGTLAATGCKNQEMDPGCEDQENDRSPGQDADEHYYRKEGAKVARHDPGKEYGLQKNNDGGHYRVEKQERYKVRQNSTDFVCT